MAGVCISPVAGVPFDSAGKSGIFPPERIVSICDYLAEMCYLSSFTLYAGRSTVPLTPLLCTLSAGPIPLQWNPSKLDTIGTCIRLQEYMRNWTTLGPEFLSVIKRCP